MSTTNSVSRWGARPVALLPTEAEGVAVLVKFFRALGEPARVRLVELLLAGERSVTECVRHVGLAQSRVSAHLAYLADCGYVQARRDGRSTYYRVADPRVGELVDIAGASVAAHSSALAECSRIDSGATAMAGKPA